MTADDAVRLYTIADLAKLWATSREYVYEEIRTNRLAVVNLANGDRDKLRVRASEAARWVEQHERVAS